MSQINERSPKHCAQKQASNFHKFNKLFYYFTFFLIILLLIILLVWFIFHPTKPRFYLKQAEIKHFKLATPSLFNSSIQLTLLSTNPNKNVGIYYDELTLYASYDDQNITPETYISAFYQEHEETNLLSTSLPYEVQRYKGSVRTVSFKVTGKLRWKIGNWISGRHRFVVNCVTIMPFRPTFSTFLSSKQGIACSTTV